MQIIVPMSGYGERFRAAGYTVPKPLIVVEGKPIIAHVVDMFPGETDFHFICNREHLENPLWRMRDILKECCPSGYITAIEPHRLGPVHSVLHLQDRLDPQKPTVINYCDFTCDWNWLDFKNFVARNRCDGAIPAYKGFHPHSLGPTHYAYLRESDGWVTDIQEKRPYTDNRLQEYASSGTYYFHSGAAAVNALRDAVALKLDHNGEYYLSLAYKPLCAAGKKIAVYPLRHFMQWGTPEDVRDYTAWSDLFHKLARGETAEPPNDDRRIFEYWKDCFNGWPTHPYCKA